MRRNSGKTLAAAHAAIETAAASAPHASPSPGCCTLTASARPSAAVARWTCARLADATGVSSKLAKSASGGEPSSEMIIFLWGGRAGGGGGGGVCA